MPQDFVRRTLTITTQVVTAREAWPELIQCYQLKWYATYAPCLENNYIRFVIIYVHTGCHTYLGQHRCSTYILAFRKIVLNSNRMILKVRGEVSFILYTIMYQFNPNNFMMTYIIYEIQSISWKGQLLIDYIYIKRTGMKTTMSGKYTKRNP